METDVRRTPEQTDGTGAPAVEVTHRTLDVNGLQMHIAEAGTGPLVLLLHGWPESWYSWRHQIPALAAAGYHVVTPDQRGYGDTEVPPRVEDYTIEHLVDDVTALIGAVGEEEAVVVGHDWGAIVAWEMAKMRPERVAAVVGLSIPDRVAEPSGAAATPIAGMRAALGDDFYIVHFQQPGIADAAFAAALERDPEGLFRRVMYTASGDGPGWSTMYRNLDRNWELSASWRDNPAQAPALFLIGGHDGTLGLPQTQELISGDSRSFPHLRASVVLPGCGHAIQQERPEEVNDVLIRFLHSL